MRTLDNIMNELYIKSKTQKELCEYLRIEEQTFTNWKSGRSHSYMKHLPKIAEFLHVSVVYLLGSDAKLDADTVNSIFISDQISTLDIISYHLKKQNKTQKELCDFLGIDKQVFSNWKNGKSHSYMKYLPKIAEFLHVSVDYLLGSDVNPDAAASNSIAPISDHDSMLDIISDLLKKQNKTQKELCEFLGINQCAFTAWKSGARESYKKYIPQIAEFLGISVDCLFGKEKQLSFEKHSRLETGSAVWNRFSSLCEKRGRTVEEVCSELHISRRTVAEWKGGIFTGGKLVASVASYFGISVDYFFCLTDDPKPEDQIAENAKKELFESLDDLTDAQIQQVQEYIAFLKSKNIK